jgi:hypothetical protein
MRFKHRANSRHESVPDLAENSIESLELRLLEAQGGFQFGDSGGKLCVLLNFA